jgi:hypothetical protein
MTLNGVVNSSAPRTGLWMLVSISWPPSESDPGARNAPQSDTVNRYAVVDSAVLSHPDSLVLPAVFADAATNVSGCGAVPQILPAGGRQCGIEL